MNERQEHILSFIVDDYIKHAEPVSSGYVARKYKSGLSSATIRNECAALAEQGYVRKAYCSSGSVPTNKAYRFFVDRRAHEEVKPVARVHVPSALTLSGMAVALSEQTQLLSFLIDENLDTAMGGMGYLFSQPDFASARDLKQLAEFIDTVVDRREEIFDALHDYPLSVFIGHENPVFSHQDNMSWIAGSCVTPEHKRVLVSLVGPTRMPYEKNVSVLSSWMDEMLHI